MSSIGTEAFPWAEAISLIMSAAADPSCALGADIAGWAYPAAMTQIIQTIFLAAPLGRPGLKALKKLMPWSAQTKKPKVSAQEFAQAQKEIECEVIFSDE